MLILTRKPGQSIHISDNVEVFVTGVNGSQVRIGIRAPLTVDIQRDEIYQKIHLEKIQRLEQQQANVKAGAL